MFTCLSYINRYNYYFETIKVFDFQSQERCFFTFVMGF